MLLRDLYTNQGKVPESSYSKYIINKVNTFELQRLSLFLGT